jgi:hypothetical protein
LHYGISLASDPQENRKKLRHPQKVKNIRSAKFVKLVEALLLFIHQMLDRKLPISRALIKMKKNKERLKVRSRDVSRTFDHCLWIMPATKRRG